MKRLTKNTKAFNRAQGLAIGVAAGFMLAVGAGAVAGNGSGLGKSTDQLKEDLLNNANEELEEYPFLSGDEASAGWTTQDAKKGVELANERIDSLVARINENTNKINNVQPTSSNMSPQQVWQAWCDSWADSDYNRITVTGAFAYSESTYMKCY